MNIEQKQSIYNQSLETILINGKNGIDTSKELNKRGKLIFKMFSFDKSSDKDFIYVCNQIVKNPILLLSIIKINIKSYPSVEEYRNDKEIKAVRMVREVIGQNTKELRKKEIAYLKEELKNVMDTVLKVHKSMVFNIMRDKTFASIIVRIAYGNKVKYKRIYSTNVMSILDTKDEKEILNILFTLRFFQKYKIITEKRYWLLFFGELVELEKIWDGKRLFKESKMQSLNNKPYFIDSDNITEKQTAILNKLQVPVPTKQQQILGTKYIYGLNKEKINVYTR